MIVSAQGNRSTGVRQPRPSLPRDSLLTIHISLDQEYGQPEKNKTWQSRSECREADLV